MSEIPEDIRKKAEALCQELDTPSSWHLSVIAHALMGERTRCANVAARFPVNYGEGCRITVLEQGEWKIASALDLPSIISSAIRSN